MDYREHINNPLSKHFIDKIAENVFENPVDFHSLYKLIFDSSNKVAWRAAWTCHKISQKHPEWFSEKHFLELA